MQVTARRFITALAAYLLRYGEIGLWLKKEAAKPVEKKGRKGPVRVVTNT